MKTMSKKANNRVSLPDESSDHLVLCGLGVYVWVRGLERQKKSSKPHPKQACGTGSGPSHPLSALRDISIESLANNALQLSWRQQRSSISSSFSSVRLDQDTTTECLMLF